MTPTAFALLSFTAWSLTLLMTLGVIRSLKVITGQRAANSFAASGDDVEGFTKRLTRAHANCYENLPVAGAIMLYAIATDQTAITDGFAYAFIAARIAQSVVHLISTSHTFVLIRFVFFIIQVAILAIWLARLFSAA